MDMCELCARAQPSGRGAQVITSSARGAVAADSLCTRPRSARSWIAGVCRSARCFIAVSGKRYVFVCVLG